MSNHQKENPKEVITKNLAEIQLLVSRSNAARNNSNSDREILLVKVSSVPSHPSQSFQGSNVVHCHKRFRNIAGKHESRCDVLQNKEKQQSKRLQVYKIFLSLSSFLFVRAYSFINKKKIHKTIKHIYTVSQLISNNCYRIKISANFLGK